MKIYTYAVLKDYFDKEFEVNEKLKTIAELNVFLTQRSPTAAAILTASRYAVGDNFVSAGHELLTDDIIHIMPPSSGG